MSKFSWAIEQSPGIFVITDPQGNIEYVNPAFTRVTGYHKDEVVGKNPRVLKSPRMELALIDDMWETISSGGAWKGELVNKKKNNEMYWEDVTISPIIGEDGNISHFIKVAVNITEKKKIREELDMYRRHLEELVVARTEELEATNRKLREEIEERNRAEQQVTSQNQLLENIIESLTHPFYVVDAETFKVKMANSSAGSTGVRVGDSCFTVAHNRDQLCDTEEHPCPLNTIKKTKRPVIMEHVHYDDKGDVHYVDIHGYPIFDKDGSVAQIIEYAIDVTERKITEEKVRLQEQQLLQADKMVALGTLVSGVAHEVNNPNNFIMMNTPLLREIWNGIMPILDRYYKEKGDFSVSGFEYHEMCEAAKELFDGILEGACRIRDIVKDLKDFARIGPPDDQQSVDINTVVNSAITLTSPMIKKATKRFSVSFGENIPTFPGRFQRLEQVIVNLLQNSCQALTDKDKGIHVGTCYNAGTDEIVVTVTDDGAGIETTDLKHITDPFFTNRRDTGGTGLGLSISSNIVTGHGGTLEFESLPGKGTTATVILPVTRKDGNG